MTLRVSKHSNQPCSVIFVNFYNFLNNDVIMSSLVSTGNCKVGHDCQRVCSHRRHDETVANYCEFVFTPLTPKRQNSFVPSASAVCIGHNFSNRLDMKPRYFLMTSVTWSTSATSPWQVADFPRNFHVTRVNDVTGKFRGSRPNGICALPESW